jgi:hypothetical protein
MLSTVFGIAVETSAFAGSVTLAWDPPTDGITTGYTVLYGTTPGVYPNRLNVGFVYGRKVDGLVTGVRYYFAVQAYNSSGVLSDVSASVSALASDSSSGGSGGSGGGSGGGSTGGGGGSSSGGSTSVSSGSITSSSGGAGATSLVATMRDGRFLDMTWLPLSGIGAYRVEVGSAPGHTAYSAVVNGFSITFDATNFSAPTYHMRVRALGAGGVPGASSNEELIHNTSAPRMDVSTSAAGAACSDAPGPPRVFNSGANGTSVFLSWQPGSGSPSTYVLQVGSAAGFYNLMTVPMPASQTSLAANAGVGVYALRLIATNDCGASAWGAESMLGVGTAAAAPVSSGPVPGMPTALTESVSGNTVMLSWAAPAGASVTRYLIEAMTDGGPVSVELGPGTNFSHPETPSGRYVITVRAGNASGFGPPSSPVTVVVP